MARPLFWAFATLIATGTPLAARAAELCQAQPQTPQRAAQSPGKPPAGKTEADKTPGRERRAHWWVDPKQRANLGITDQQSAAVEQIWQKNAPGLREIWNKLEKLEEELAALSADPKADEHAVLAKIDAVENIRAEGNKRRTLMIYRMNKVLSPDQQAKVKAMFEAREASRKLAPVSR
jgi:Spy/CpxP family protein refolding chaperone